MGNFYGYVAVRQAGRARTNWREDRGRESGKGHRERRCASRCAERDKRLPPLRGGWQYFWKVFGVRKALKALHACIESDSNKVQGPPQGPNQQPHSHRVPQVEARGLGWDVLSPSRAREAFESSVGILFDLMMLCSKPTQKDTSRHRPAHSSWPDAPGSTVRRTGSPFSPDIPRQHPFGAVSSGRAGRKQKLDN